MLKTVVHDTTAGAANNACCIGADIHYPVPETIHSVVVTFTTVATPLAASVDFSGTCTCHKRQP